MVLWIRRGCLAAGQAGQGLQRVAQILPSFWRRGMPVDNPAVRERCAVACLYGYPRKLWMSLCAGWGDKAANLASRGLPGFAQKTSKINGLCAVGGDTSVGNCGISGCRPGMPRVVADSSDSVQALLHGQVVDNRARAARADIPG